MLLINVGSEPIIAEEFLNFVARIMIERFYPKYKSKFINLTLTPNLADELDRIAQERFTSRLG